jgi:hypothetical protein
MDDDFFGAEVAKPPVSTQNAAFDGIDDVFSRPAVPAIPTPSSPQPLQSVTTSALSPSLSTPTQLPPTPPVTPVGSPQRTLDGSPTLALLEKQISERTVACDKATKEKEDRAKSAAKAYIDQANEQRAATLKSIKEEHKKVQAEEEKKNSDLKRSGAIWDSVGRLVNLGKPNVHSKKTERMRMLLTKLQQTQ